MKIILAAIAVVIIAGSAWFMFAPRSQTAAQLTADSFASDAIKSMDRVPASTQPEGATTSIPLTPATSTPQTKERTGQSAVTTTPTPKPTTVNDKKITRAILKTNLGTIIIEFFTKDAPNTVANFVKLSKAGFYDGTKFHRVIKGFMIQGGDPLSKDDTMINRWGTGGPGYAFNDELRAGNNNVIGTISMANSGPNTNGSQFFINVANNSFLDGKHTTFGHVTSGMDVVNKIEATETGVNDRPNTSMVIEKVTLE